MTLKPSIKRPPPTITALYLVKNEIEFMPRSVATVIDGVDEVVIIDTQSTDGTFEKAKEMAAHNPKIKVHQFEADFDSACEFNCRNRSVAYASGDWLLTPDADQLLSDGWRAHIDKYLRDHRCESIAVGFEHLVGSYEYIHKSFYEKQKNPSLHPDVPLTQTCFFRRTNTLAARAAADTCPQFRPQHHSRMDESVPYRARRICNEITMSHYGFAKLNSMYMGEYRVLRGDYGHTQERKDELIAEIRKSHNGFKFVGSVTRVDYDRNGPKVPSVMRPLFDNTYRLELDADGFIQKRTFASTGELTP
jgi:glycosyltransferase involved in cell wall biosynthesis